MKHLILTLALALASLTASSQTMIGTAGAHLKERVLWESPQGHLTCCTLHGLPGSRKTWYTLKIRAHDGRYYYYSEIYLGASGRSAMDFTEQLRRQARARKGKVLYDALAMKLIAEPADTAVLVGFDGASHRCVITLQDLKDIDNAIYKSIR